MNGKTDFNLGNWAEDQAEIFLMGKGYKIVERNYRYAKAEVDIIAWEDHILVFVEVKARSYDSLGSPESFVDQKKKRLLATAASAFMEEIGHDGELRFDIISILKRKDGSTYTKHFVDAFFPGL